MTTRSHPLRTPDSFRGVLARRLFRGFTIGELAIVVGILGLLAAIAIPTFLGQRTGAMDAAAISTLRNVAAQARSMISDIDAAHDPDAAPAFPADLLAQLTPVSAHAIGASFPDPLIPRIEDSEKAYELVEGNELSEGPNEVSVGMPIEVPGDGLDPAWDDTNSRLVLAALSESGTCFYLGDDLSRGIRWAQDTSEDAYLKCYAGRVKWADSRDDFDEDSVYVAPDAPLVDDPVFFPDVSGPSHEDLPDINPDAPGPGGEGSGSTTTTLPGGSTTTTLLDQSHHQVVAGLGPIAHWPFNDDGSDDTAHALIGGPDLPDDFTGAPGTIWGQSGLTISGDLAVSTNSAFEPAGSPFDYLVAPLTSYSFEMIFDLEFDGYFELLRIGAGDADVRNVKIGAAEGQVWAQIYTNSEWDEEAYVMLPWEDRLIPGNPYHLVVTVSAGFINIYVNGDPVLTEGVPGDSSIPGNATVSWIRVLDNFSGTFDELVIYPTDLTPAQVSTLAAAAGLAE